MWEVISKTSGLERAGHFVHRAVRTGGARGAIRSKTFYSKKALDYYLPPQIFQIFLWPWYLKTFSKLNLGYNQLDKCRPTSVDKSRIIPTALFGDNSCLCTYFWPFTSWVCGKQILRECQRLVSHSRKNDHSWLSFWQKSKNQISPVGRRLCATCIMACLPVWASSWGPFQPTPGKSTISIAKSRARLLTVDLPGVSPT